MRGLESSSHAIVSRFLSPPDIRPAFVLSTSWMPSCDDTDSIWNAILLMLRRVYAAGCSAETAIMGALTYIIILSLYTSQCWPQASSHGWEGMGSSPHAGPVQIGDLTHIFVIFLICFLTMFTTEKLTVNIKLYSVHKFRETEGLPRNENELHSPSQSLELASTTEREIHERSSFSFHGRPSDF
jgi:hypothetical protein